MREPGWELRLASVLEGWRGNVYDLATANCLLFARDVIMAVRGRPAADQPVADPLWQLGTTLEAVTTPMGAARLLAQHQHDPAAIINAVLGAPVPVLTAGRGDLAAVAAASADGKPIGEGVSIGVVDGSLIHVICHDFGMTYRPLGDALAAWGVS